MHMYAKCDKNIPCGSRVMKIFTNWLQTDSHSYYSADPRVMQFMGKHYPSALSLMIDLAQELTVSDGVVW